MFAAATAGPSSLPESRVTLSGFASLPAQSFALGTPATGAFDDSGRRRTAPRFAAQPIQGVSSIKPGSMPGTWWALSDNGFGSRANSSDYRLAIYLFSVTPAQRSGKRSGSGRVELLARLELRDPNRVFPWRIAEEVTAARVLTGADIDPESFVILPDGSFWVSDEIGPWLLHFGPDGVLLAPPVDLRLAGAAEGAGASAVAEDRVLRSASHPLVMAGGASAQIRNSKGLEGLAFAPGSASTLLAMLEGPLPGDVPDELRILEFDTTRNAWTGRSARYPLDDPKNAIGELALGASGKLLIIERDDLQGDSAQFKRVFEVAWTTAATPEASPRLQKRLMANLLDIADPQRLATRTGRFRFPFWTIEAIHQPDSRTLVIVNDNNFPASGGRGLSTGDPTEWIWLRLPR